MLKFLKLLKEFIFKLLKKTLELFGVFCEICSACMRYDFDAIDNNNNKKDK